MSSLNIVLAREQAINAAWEAYLSGVPMSWLEMT